MIEINLRPGRRELRQFAVLLPIFILLISVLFFRWIGSTAIGVAVGSATVIALFGWFLPHVIRPIYIGWMILAFPIGWTISHLILISVFFLVFTPLGWIICCLFGDPMKRRFDPNAKTYWEPRQRQQDGAAYFRQF